jgi:hypothetical protein
LHLSAIPYGYVPSDNEAQTERDLVRKVLEALNHTFEVQAGLRTSAGVQFPDYVFYRDLESVNANKGKTLTAELLEAGGLAVGDAKYWDRPLDLSLKRKDADPLTNANPSYQISFYIQQSGVEWGILTNGRLWRLYHRNSAHRLDRFYEVNLPDLVSGHDVHRFLYFFAFFRREAFTVQPLGLEAILRASADYARGVGDSLKDQVYEALRHAAQGLLDYAPNKLVPTDQTLKEIYDASLIVLYRLLFVLHTESRELLPITANESYREDYSLSGSV